MDAGSGSLSFLLSCPRATLPHWSCRSGAAESSSPVRNAAGHLARSPARSDPMRRKTFFVAAGLLTIAMMPHALSQGSQKLMTISATEPMTTDNPYGDSSSPVYSLWCHTYGCLGRYDYTQKKPIGIL